MRIQCPACDSVYAVPDRMLEGRRTVRCARCGHGFAPVAVPEAAAAEEEPVADGADAPVPAVVEAPGPPLPPALAPLPILTRLSATPPPAPPRRRLPLLPLAWAASITTVALAFALLVIDRHAIAAAWPPMQRLYGLIGLG